MNFRFKHAVAVSALTLALLGGASGFSTLHHSAHASMGSPELYYSNGHHHNVYYAVSGGLEGNTLLKDNRLYYGRMPSRLRRRGGYIQLYHGRLFDKVADSVNKYFPTLHRHGQSYLPDYVGWTPHNVSRFHGKKEHIMFIYINTKEHSL